MGRGAIVGMSLVQPEPWTVLRAGVRLIRLDCPAPIVPVDRILIHASTVDEHDHYDAGVRELVRRGIRAPWHADVPRGGFVASARCTIVASSLAAVCHLSDVEPLPCLVPAPAPKPGVLFRVEEATLARATMAARGARSVEEFAAVAGMWAAERTARRSRVRGTDAVEVRA